MRVRIAPPAVLGVAIAALIYRGASRTAVKSHHLERDRETGAVPSYAG